MHVRQMPLNSEVKTCNYFGRHDAKSSKPHLIFYFHTWQLQSVLECNVPEWIVAGRTSLIYKKE